MINELVLFEKHLTTLGINLDNLSCNHPCWQAVPKTGKYILVKIDENGKTIVEHLENKDHLFYYKDHIKQALTFKLDKNCEKLKVIKKIENGFKNSIWLADLCDLPVLTTLAERLDKVNVGSLLEQLCEFQEGFLKNCFYLTLDLAEGVSLIQNQKTLKEINLQLISKTSGEVKEKNFTLKQTLYKRPTKAGGIRSFNLKYYARNNDNDCFERYGLEGSKLFPISDFLTQKISQVVEALASKQLIVPINLNDKNFYILTSVIKDFLEGEPLDLEEWGQASNDILEKLLEQKNCGGTQNGLITVLLDPGNGAWSIEYQANWSYENIDKYLRDWDAGVKNSIQCNYMKIPNVFSLTSVMSKHWIFESSGELFGQPNKNWKLIDSFNFFANDSGAVKKAARIAAQELVPKFIQMGCKHWAFDQVPVIFGLILNKKGINMEDSKQHWAYKLGRLFSLADLMQKVYFNYKNLPNKLIGNTHLTTALKNPKQAWSLFFKKFHHPYYSWASQQCPGLISEFNELCSSLQDIPSLANDEEIILMSNGYCFRPKKEIEEVAEEIVEKE